MVKAALHEAGPTLDRLQILLPHSFPEQLRHYVPIKAVHLFTIYDDWGERKLRSLQSLGFTTEVIRRREHKEVEGSTLGGACAARSIRHDQGVWNRCANL